MTVGRSSGPACAGDGVSADAIEPGLSVESNGRRLAWFSDDELRAELDRRRAVTAGQPVTDNGREDVPDLMAALRASLTPAGSGTTADDQLREELARWLFAHDGSTATAWDRLLNDRGKRVWRDYADEILALPGAQRLLTIERDVRKVMARLDECRATAANNNRPAVAMAYNDGAEWLRRALGGGGGA